MRELNSMFLDEGFGTLDSDTLETVASTLERLAADSDRMVGVITHVTELAERVPVRFVVSRSRHHVDDGQGARMTTVATPRSSFSVDPWDPGYGMAFGEEMSGEPLPGVQRRAGPRPGAAGRPVAAAGRGRLGPVPGTLLFLDGVRRIDARVWVHGADPQPSPGIAASYAAGLVCLQRVRPDQRRRRRARPVHRGAPMRPASTAGTRSYPAWMSPPVPAWTSCRSRLQQRLSDAEVQLALLFRKENPDADDLLFVDGPLRGRTHLDRTIGYIKTHHTTYLPPEQAAVVGALRARPAHARVHHGHVLAAQLLVPAPAGFLGRPLVGRGTAGVLRRPARSRDQAAGRPQRARCCRR